MAIDYRALFDSRRFSREQAETLIALSEAVIAEGAGLSEAEILAAIATGFAALTIPPTVFCFNVAAQGMTNQPSALTPFLSEAAGRRAVPIDLTAYAQCRLSLVLIDAGHTTSMFQILAASASPLVQASYTQTLVEVATSASGVIDSGWIDIPAPASIDGFVAPFTIGGNLTADPTFGAIHLWLR
jgi:hypothetical protein